MRGVLVAAACIATAPVARGVVVFDNTALDDYVTPVVLPAEDTALGFKLKNISSGTAGFRVSLPVSFFDANGEVLSAGESPGRLAVRLISDASTLATRFTYGAITGSPAAGEMDYLIPLSPMAQNQTVLGGSLQYGIGAFDLPGAAVAPGATVMAAMRFVPNDNPSTGAASMIVFRNAGMDPDNQGYILPHLESGWIASPEYTGDLLLAADPNIAGPNKVYAYALKTLAPTLLMGDANGDGTVNSLDFDALANNYGRLTGATWTMGDFDADGKVTTTDFNLLAGNFGVSSSAALGASVPEPSAILLLVGLLPLRRRR